MLGYVRTDYCKRDIRDVEADVRLYAGWNAKFRMAGIFFDETPNLEDESGDGRVGRYLGRIAGYVKGCSGIEGKRMVVNNPGTVPGMELASKDIDVWTVFEDSHGRWQDKEVREWQGTNRYPWKKCCFMVHSAPRGEIGELVKELKGRGKYLFVTDLKERLYEGFGEGWSEFVDAVDGLGC